MSNLTAKETGKSLSGAVFFQHIDFEGFLPQKSLRIIIIMPLAVAQTIARFLTLFMVIQYVYYFNVQKSVSRQPIYSPPKKSTHSSRYSNYISPTHHKKEGVAKKVTRTEHLILNMLKKELEYHDPEEPYSLWIMAISVRAQEEDINQTNTRTGTHMVRVILKDSYPPYVDGTDIPVIVTGNRAKINNAAFAEYPKYPCVKEDDALQWLKTFSDPCFLQLTDPYIG